MTIFQLLMLGASAFFAFKIYEHIQSLKEPEQNNGDNSENGVKSAEAFSPFSPEALLIKADDAFANDDKEKALALLIEANAKEKENPDTLFKIAYILQAQNNDDEAMEHYKEALKFDKENEFIHNAIASIYRKNGEYASAKMHLQASLDIDAQNAITYYNYGNLLADMKKKEEAIEMYQKALEIRPDFDEAKQELQNLQEK